MSSKWLKLPCKVNQVQLLGTLNGGQSFRWQNTQIGDEQHWIGVIEDKVWILQQTKDAIIYKVHPTDSTLTEQQCNEELSNYLQLNVDLEDHYKDWRAKDANFDEAAKSFYGIRILKQNVVENIFSFICSQNNHISRITSMVENLATFYGDRICEINGKTYYTFPKVEKLAQPDVEQTLRNNKFGYRAKYISKCAQTISDGGGDIWIKELKKMDYLDAKNRLVSLMGIGAKVADCICLMSLGHLQAIPVDTHIYQIAAKYYMPKLDKKKNVTEKIYKEIGNHFRDLYGPLAGWAHTVLFCADLKKFQDDRNGDKPGKRKKQKTC